MIRPCPECGVELEFETTYPPIPMTLHRWFLDERELLFCPSCDAELPDSPIVKAAA